MDPELLADMRSGIELLNASIEAQITGNTALIESTRKRLAAEDAERRRADSANREVQRRRNVEKAMHEATQEDHKRTQEQLNKTKDSFKKLGGELLKISDAGVKFASTVGTTATKGVELEIKNRIAVAAQLFNFNTNLAVTVEQLKSTQAGFSDVFIGAAEGMQLSAEGSRRFASELKKGFGSEFQATPETFRMLVEMGMSNAQQMENFRKATGRAGLTAGQLSTLYGQNRLSFLLYGNSFAKAAVEAQRLGVNLASIQAAQEGLVTNLDGTIDTVAQINQLGGSIDFGNLTRIAEQEGPDALMAYVRATVPEQLMQSASTRALFKQLGISVEDYLKSGQKQVSAADQLEAKMTEQASKTGTVTNTLGALGAMVSRIAAILQGSFGPLAISAYAAALALSKVAASGGLGSLLDKAKKLPGLGKAGMVGTGAAIGIGGAMAGRSLVEQGYRKTGIATGAGLAALGTAIALAPFTGGMSLALLAAGGGLAGGIYASRGKSPTPVQDLVLRPGEKRVVTGPEGSFITSAKDTLFALAGLGDVGSNISSDVYILNLLKSAYGKRFLLTKSILANPYLNSLADIGLSLGQGEGLKKALIGGGGSLLGGIGGQLAGAALGRVVGGALGSALGPIGTVLGGMAGSYLAGKFLADDMASSGYGNRTLVTPSRMYALNNADDIVAGTNLFPKGTLNMGTSKETSDTSALITKVNELISVLQNSKTVINIDNKAEEVPRSNLVGVYVRNERRV